MSFLNLPELKIDSLIQGQKTSKLCHTQKSKSFTSTFDTTMSEELPCYIHISSLTKRNLFYASHRISFLLH